MTFIGNVIGSKGVGTNIFQPFPGMLIMSKGLRDDQGRFLKDDQSKILLEDI